MKGLITAGGRGTRMRPVTFSTNKHFIPIANKPLLFYGLEEMINAGIKEIGINYNPGQVEELKAVLGSGDKWGVNFTYILQEKPLGLANIIEVSRDFIGKNKFVMHLGDNIFWGGIKDLIDKFRQSDANGMVTVIKHPENFRMGVPYLNKDGSLKEIIEKPEKPPHNLAVPGLYFFDKHALECFDGKNKIIPSSRGEYEIGSVYNWLVDNGFQVEIAEFKGTWKDPGKFNDWLDTNRFILDESKGSKIESNLSKDVIVEGRVFIGENCRISSSRLRGPLVIGNNVEISDSFIGPYSSIFDHCKIEKAKVENSVLMKNVQINSPGKPLDSCLLGRETIISGNHQPAESIELFLGNHCRVKM
jgi:glucose-1-phosphate thymidylyltransferase